MKNIYLLGGLFLLFSCRSPKADCDATGVFEATEITVSAQNQGEILAIYFQDGENVDKGQCLAQIDTMSLYLQQKLINVNDGLPKKIKEAQREQLDFQMDKAKVKSPLTGVILTKYVEKGEWVNVGTPIFKIADLSRMYLRVYVTGAQLSKLKTGQEVKIFPQNNKTVYQGKITWISDEAEFTPKDIQTEDERENLVYALRIELKNDGLLKIGNYADVCFSAK